MAIMDSLEDLICNLSDAPSVCVLA
jgi:hypothetical protein